MADHDVDVWVLTETHDDVSPGQSFRCIAYSAARDDGRAGERWVAIWARCFASKPHTVLDAQFSALVQINYRKPW